MNRRNSLTGDRQRLWAPRHLHKAPAQPPAQGREADKADVATRRAVRRTFRRKNSRASRS